MHINNIYTLERLIFGDFDMNMNVKNNSLNLVLSGGGIKGIAFVGAIEELEKRYRRFGNIAGVSAGALVGALVGAGYTSRELIKILKEFDFSILKIRAGNCLSVSINERIARLGSEKGNINDSDVEALLYMQDYPELKALKRHREDFKGVRGNFLSNMIAFSQENAFLDGDLLERWVGQLLAGRGIYTFGDFRGGIIDKVNPRGYKVRMTAVDANTGRVVVLPDDIALYNIDPDRLEVAKAVRMSSSIPFVFKPCVLMKKENNMMKQHYLIDGGVLDNFPVWLIDSSQGNIVGLRLEGKEPKELKQAENMLKKLLASSHDIGVPKNSYNIDNIAHIDTGNISFLDFDISPVNTQFLYEQGKSAAQKLLVSMNKRSRGWR